MIADVIQNPTKRCRASGFIPTVTRTADFVRLAEGDKFCHFFTAGELGMSQGWPSAAAIDAYAPCSPQGALTRREQRNIRGNVMFLPVVGSIRVWVLSNVVQRDVVAQYSPPLKPHVVHGGDGDSDSDGSDGRKPDAKKQRLNMQLTQTLDDAELFGTVPEAGGDTETGEDSDIVAED